MWRESWYLYSALHIKSQTCHAKYNYNKYDILIPSLHVSLIYRGDWALQTYALCAKVYVTAASPKWDHL